MLPPPQQPCSHLAWGRSLHSAHLRPFQPVKKAFRPSHRQLRTAAQSQQTAARAPEGLTTLPWDGTPEQQQALRAVSERMASSPFGIPNDTTMQWFLRDRKFDVDETVNKLEKMMKWRQDFRVDDITEHTVSSEKATGKAFVHTHQDVNGRPVIIIRVEKHITKEFPLDDSKRHCVHLLEVALAQLPEGGDTLLGVFDLRGFRNRNADLGFVRFLVDIFFTYYPKRLGQVLFVDAPWLFQPGWEVVKPWLKKYSALVRFVDRKTLVAEYFTPDTAPKEFLS